MSINSGSSLSICEQLIASKRLVFIVGAPRSGTTWLQLLLSRSPQIATANGTHLFSVYTRSLFSGWDLYNQHFRKEGLNDLMDKQEYLELVRHFCCKVF